MATDTKENALANDITVDVVVSSFYETDDLMRYRIGLMRSMLIPSLQQQTDRRFRLVWHFPVGSSHFDEQVKMLDRSGLIWSLGSQHSTGDRCEIHVTEYMFVNPEMVEAARMTCGDLRQQDVSQRVLWWRFGHEFHQGRFWGDEKHQPFALWRSATLPDPVPTDTTCFIFMNQNSWIVPLMYGSRDTAASTLVVPIAGFNMDLAHRYISARIATGTSNGSTLDPYKSKSLIKVRDRHNVPRGKRRRDNDVAN